MPKKQTSKKARKAKKVLPVKVDEILPPPVCDLKSGGIDSIASAASREQLKELDAKNPSPDEEDNRVVRNEDELYARVVRLTNNPRYVIVCPYVDGFGSGRMVLPRRGKGRKVFEKDGHGKLIEKTKPSAFSKMGKKLWVKYVSEGLYEYVH